MNGACLNGTSGFQKEDWLQKNMITMKPDEL
jgi:hypothetical protein